MGFRKYSPFSNFRYFLQVSSDNLQPFETPTNSPDRYLGSSIFTEKVTTWYPFAVAEAITKEYSFGGACFTKDCSAFITFAQSQDIDLSTLEHIVKVNNIIRSQYALDDREKEQNVRYDVTP